MPLNEYSPAGRKRHRSNAGPGHVIGVDIGGSNLRVALADRQGALLGKRHASLAGNSSPRMVIKGIRDGVEHLLRDSAVPRSSLQAVAAAAPGVTEAHAGVVIATSYLKGWRDVPLRSLLESALGVPAAVENDVKLAALGESWMGAARGIRDFVFLAIGTGIAAGIVVDGQLVHGVDLTAGEVGYMLVPGTTEAPAQRGEPGPLESVIGGEGIRTQWLRCCDCQGTEARQNLSATEIFECARAGDALARGVLDRTARVLAYAVYNISLVLNCPLFVLGGGVGMSAILCDATQAVLDEYTEPARPRVTLSRLGQDAQLMGAIRLALDSVESRSNLRVQSHRQPRANADR